MTDAIKPFSMKVEDIFRFGDGSIVFVGGVTGGGRVITPSEVTLQKDGLAIATITLAGERMPGPNLPVGSRVVFTRDPVKIDTTIDKTRYSLVYSGASTV
jgi:hypothetical protein